MDGTMTLVTESYTTNAIGERIPTETTTDIICSVTSVGRGEWYMAGQAGLTPELVARTNYSNYNGQKIAIWESVRYAIYRTYINEDTDDIELYLQREAGV